MNKLIQAGNSLAVTIPAKFVKKIGAKAGDEVSLKLEPREGMVEVKFKNLRQLPLITK